jgi:putative selenate reductase
MALSRHAVRPSALPDFRHPDGLSGRIGRFTNRRLWPAFCCYFHFPGMVAHVAQLSPCPFGALVTRMFRELETDQRIFDLPATSFVLGDPAHDSTVRFHGRDAATPFGPAAGPHSQLAQNIVLSWLAGGRIIELKTIQANDRITVPRPCIDMRTVGFNVEWSQELTLEQSLEEYVKAWMLIHMLVASGELALAPRFDRFAFDVSVGYDFAGITSERVLTFLRGMRNAAPVIDRLRRQIPSEWRRYGDIPFDPCVASTATLSTFHGCPPREIERILGFLLRDLEFAAVVKLNPTLLGCQATEALLHDALGYTDIRLVRSAFDDDLRWDEMCGLVDRVARVADDHGRGFGIKLTNTLVVENEGDFLPPSEPRKYLSGPPLHVIAMQLVQRARRTFGSRLPISFSGGIDCVNFPDAVALGLTPVTVCTDFLKPGGYRRGHAYFRELARRMDVVGARTIDEFIAGAYRLDAGVRDPIVANTDRYVNGLPAQTRYRREYHARPPRKIGRRLRLLECLMCDKCVSVCPNDANFSFLLPPRVIGNVADLCNDCGNCDVFCPEDGGPQRLKPRFFASGDVTIGVDDPDLVRRVRQAALASPGVNFVQCFPRED